MKRKTLGVAVAVAVGMLSTSAFAITQIANDGNKGSLLIYSRIQATDGVDTLITLTNDSTKDVLLKCYYATSAPMSTPFFGSAYSLKKFRDFTIDLTKNQPISWWASTGDAVEGSGKLGDQVAPPFVYGQGELKCWAITADGMNERHYNHLFGNASLMDYETMQAAEYSAVAFQALQQDKEGGALDSPGDLELNNVEYDGGPVMLLGNFQPYGFANAKTRVTLASVNQDLRQNYTPTVSKLKIDFWNQDEKLYTNNHWCANSWFESWLNSTIDTSYFALGTASAYFRIQTNADSSICANSQTGSYVGIIEQWNGVYVVNGTLDSDSKDAYYRATGLTGRGKAAAANFGNIQWDPEPADSTKK
jgi:hypothetical protein